MAAPFIGEIRMFPFGYNPQGWLPCAGQILDMQHYWELGSLLKDKYGGDGVRHFALPDLRGRVPIHGCQDLAIGQYGGSNDVSLTMQQIPRHPHAVVVSGNDSDQGASGGVLANVTFLPCYRHRSPDDWPVRMHPDGVGHTGEGKPHENRQPSLVTLFCIATYGMWPTHNSGK